MLINAETRGMTHRIIWCNISKKLEGEKINEKVFRDRGSGFAKLR